MLNIQGSSGLRRIVVLNPKGGAGKTTLAFNLAGYLAATKRKVALIDMDKQGSSSHWLARRPAENPPIHGVSASTAEFDDHTSLEIALPPEIDFAVIDAPAAIPRDKLAEFTVGSHAIIVPVMPSELDIHAASRLIADLLLVARVSRENGRLAVIANRVKERTIAYKQLMKFLDRLSIPVIGVIRDSQNYVSAAREGQCIHELPASKAAKDLKRWEPVIHWLDQKLETPLDERDLGRPDAVTETPEPPRARRWKPAMAAVIALVAVALLVWNVTRTPDTEAPVPPVAAVDQTGRDGAGDTRLSPAAGGAADEAAKSSGSDVAETAAESRETSAPSVAQNGTRQPGGAVASGPARAVADGRTVGESAGAEPPRSTSGGMATAGEKSTPPEVAASDSAGPEPARARDTLSQKWQLSGVVESSGGHVVLLTDTLDSSTRTVTADIDVDGWRVRDAGRDFAVFAKDGAEVRLDLVKRSADPKSTESQ